MTHIDISFYQNFDSNLMILTNATFLPHTAKSNCDGGDTYIVGSFRPDFEDLAQPQLNTLNKQMLLKLNQLDIPNWDLGLIPMSTSTSVRIK